jgi:cytochrome o ubiquinol oxidase subunit 2
MTRSKVLFLILVGFTLLFFAILFFENTTFTLFNPKGVIAREERNIMIAAVALMLLIVLPVYVLIFGFAWRYRAGNSTTKPRESRERPSFEIALWLLPTGVVVLLGILGWQGTHALDPYKPIESTARPITIQVVALNWKWLFIYPEQNIATVNFVAFPERTPLNFELTADAPMNSFWIPELGGQMYAMAGMITRLHLMADGPGEFSGSAAEINGAGFASMRFVAKAMTQADFGRWVATVRESSLVLSSDVYDKLAKPSERYPVTYFASVEPNLERSIVFKYAPSIGGTH